MRIAPYGDTWMPFGKIKENLQAMYRYKDAGYYNFAHGFGGDREHPAFKSVSWRFVSEQSREIIL